MPPKNTNRGAGDAAARLFNGLQFLDSTNCPTAQVYIGRITPARGCYFALDRFGRPLAVAPTIESARDAIVGWYRAAHRGGLLLVEGGAA